MGAWVNAIPAFDRLPGQETDVCLIVEGCYPHVTGGVASWVDWLMRNLPDHSFSVVSIVSGSEPRRSKYEFPSNLMRFRELNLKGDGTPRPHWGLSRPSGDAEAMAGLLVRFLREGELDALGELIDFIRQLGRRPSLATFTRSQFGWDVICSMYRSLMPQASFVDFFWAWQSLVGGLLATIEMPLPRARIYHTISTGYAGLLAARAAIETGRTAMVTEHGIYTNERRIEILMADWIVDTIDKGLSIDDNRLDLRDLWIMAFESFARTCYQACDRITTLYGDNQKLQTDLGADPDRLMVIPNGIDVDRFGSIVAADDDPPTMALVGRVVPIKDVKTFIAAAAMVRSRIPGLRALVLGPLDEDPEYVTECRELIAELDLEGTVTLTGRVNVMEWLPHIHVMVLSSLSEAQPLTILEAGAAGIPCVTTNVGSCREILIGMDDEDPPCGVGGVVTDVVSPDQIAEAVAKLLRDDDLRRSMGESLRQRVRRFYSTDRSREAYRRLYLESLSYPEAASWPA